MIKIILIAMSASAHAKKRTSCKNVKSQLDKVEITTTTTNDPAKCTNASRIVLNNNQPADQTLFIKKMIDEQRGNLETDIDGQNLSHQDDGEIVCHHPYLRDSDVEVTCEKYIDGSNPPEMVLKLHDDQSCQPEKTTEKCYAVLENNDLSIKKFGPMLAIDAKEKMENAAQLQRVVLCDAKANGKTPVHGTGKNKTWMDYAKVWDGFSYQKEPNNVVDVWQWMTQVNRYGTDDKSMSKKVNELADKLSDSLVAESSPLRL